MPDYRGYAGRIAAGSVEVGDVVALPGGRSAVVERVTVAGEDVRAAVEGQSVAVSLDAEFDLARGDLISSVDRPEDRKRFTAVAVHLSDSPLNVGRVVEVRYGSALVRGRIASIDALIDIIIAAKSREELTTACHALDRVIRAGRYWVPHWYLAAHRIAYWEVFGRPQRQPKYFRGIPLTWWYDKDKAAKL